MVTEQIEERRPRRRPRDRYQSSRIYYAADYPPSFLATWTSRLSIFAAVAFVVTLVLHRLLLLPTAVALTIAIVVFAGAALALVMAAIAGLDIWVTGRQGAARVFVGSVVALGLLALPAGAWVLSFSTPEINDVSTDLTEPPEFTEAKDERASDANPVDYPGEHFAALQRQNYPDLKSLVLPRSTEEAYELVLQALGEAQNENVARAAAGGRRRRTRIHRAFRPIAHPWPRRRHRHSRARRRQDSAHRRALGVALRGQRLRSQRRARARHPERNRRAVRGLRARSRQGRSRQEGRQEQAQRVERARSGVKGRSEATRPFSIRYSTWA